MTLLLLAVVGSVEAVVYQGRYRATHGTPMAVGLWTLAVCVLRVLFVGLGVGAIMGGAGLVAAVACYAVPAALTTYIASRVAGDHRKGGCG